MSQQRSRTREKNRQKADQERSSGVFAILAKPTTTPQPAWMSDTNLLPKSPPRRT